MDKHFLTYLSCCLITSFLLLTPAVASTIGVNYLASGWTVSDFHTLSIPTRAIEFDSLGNIYIEDTTDDNSGEIKILKLDASSGYSTPPSEFASYDTTYEGVTGLDFDDQGSLYVSERSMDGDAGIIREIDVATQALLGDVMSFSNHRPTGIDADTTGNVYYSGRRDSDFTWGKIFEIDSSLIRTELSGSTVATGIASDALGDVFISTPKATGFPLVNNSIYKFDSGDFTTPTLIATFDQRGGELTFDDDDNLYFVAEDKRSIVKLSAVPVPAAVWLFGSGLIGLIGVARRKELSVNKSWSIAAHGAG